MLSLPRPILLTRLTYAALVPFAVLTLLLWIVNAKAHPFVATGMLMYGAVIASFLGGIQWSLAFSANDQNRHKDLLASVALSLLAWICAMMPPYAGLPLLGLVHVGSYLVDRKTWPAQGLAEWMTLRFRFTALTTFCCLMGAAAT